MKDELTERAIALARSRKWRALRARLRMPLRRRARCACDSANLPSQAHEAQARILASLEQTWKHLKG